MQAERDAVVEQATAANLQTLKLSTANEELERHLEVLRQNPFEAENQALQHEIVVTPKPKQIPNSASN